MDIEPVIPVTKQLHLRQTGYWNLLYNILIYIFFLKHYFLIIILSTQVLGINLNSVDRNAPSSCAEVKSVRLFLSSTYKPKQPSRVKEP